MLNSVTILAIRKTSSLPKPLKTLLLSLAVSDLSVGLLVQPFYIAHLANGLEQNTENNYSATFSNTYTAILISTSTFLSWASFFGVLALTVDRFLVIHLHLRYQEFVNKRAVAVVISIMVLTLFLSSFPLWIQVNDRRKIYIAIQFVCQALNAVIYCKIYLTFQRHRNQI